MNEESETEAGFLGTAPPSQSAGQQQQARTTVRLFVALLKKEVVTNLRYGVNFVVGQLSFFLVFIIIVEGGRRVAGPSFGDRLGGLVVGYLVFFIAQFAFTEVSGLITKESQWGTLERLYLSPLGFGRVVAVAILASFCFVSVQIALQLLLALVFTGESLVIDPVTVIPVATLGGMSVLGIGLAVGGATLLYKRLENATTLFSFAVIALISAPVDQLPWLRLFPIVQANYLLGEAMRNGIRLWEFSPQALGVLIAVGVGYLAAGYGLFRLFLRRARIRGVLGDY